MNLEDLHLCVKDTPVGSVWQHKKGGIYTVTGHVMIEATWQIGVVYHGSQGVGIVRDADEFLDGRFTRLKQGASV